MRKIFITSFLILLSVAMISGSAYALSGVCSNCHTMHNSQNGSGEVQTYASGSITTGVATPQEYLLKATCIACHAGSTATATNSFGAPIVVHTTQPTGQGASKTLAGGDFWWVATGLGATSSKGHNVSGLAAQETAPMNAPPGFNNPTSTVAGTVGTDWTTNQLTCAGTYGCHGVHTTSGILTAHHGNTGGTATTADTASNIGNSYRFLGGIKGKENTNWNWGETASVHNEYFGANSPDSRVLGTTYDNKTTISFSCAECHGFFHSKIDNTSPGGTPWIRHPTDIVLKLTGEYAAYQTYSVEAPVARPTVLSGSNGVVTPGTDIVMCLSCHRAHGSPEPDLLRWTYSGMIAGGGGADTGCFTCHTSKN